MKQKISLASSTSILIGAVIAILALLRGPAQTVLLLLTFALWGLWVLLAFLRPSWQSNRDYRYYNYSTADMWTIGNFNALPRKGFRPWFHRGWYSIIPQARFIGILSTI